MYQTIMGVVTKQFQQNNIHYQNCRAHYTHIIYFYGAEMLSGLTPAHTVRAYTNNNNLGLEIFQCMNVVKCTKSKCLLNFIVDVKEEENQNRTKEIGEKWRLKWW